MQSAAPTITTPPMPESGFNPKPTKMSPRPYRVIISGGGTGGHIFPAVAIANELRRRQPEAEILFVGANGRMEMTRVPEAGYEIVGLDISGLQRRLTPHPGSSGLRARDRDVRRRAPRSQDDPDQRAISMTHRDRA